MAILIYLTREINLVQIVHSFNKHLLNTFYMCFVLGDIYAALLELTFQLAEPNHMATPSHKGSWEIAGLAPHLSEH